MTAPQLSPDDEIALMLADDQARRTGPLTSGDMEVLEFARLHWRYVGAQEDAVMTRFGHSLARYHQRLNSVLDKPAAAAYDPVTVHRLLDARTHNRATHAHTPR